MSACTRYFNSSIQGLSHGTLWFSFSGANKTNRVAPPTDPTVKQYLKAAKRGDAEAQCKVADAYRDGKGVERSYAEAVKWYRAAAEQGHAQAQNRLGVRYASGQGVTRSYAEAAKWWRKAAEQGNAEAQYDLAGVYVVGEGVPQSHEEASRWYCIAAENGSKNVQEFLFDELKEDNAQRETFTIFGISLGEPCPFPTRKDDTPFAGSTHVVELQKPFRHFTEAKVYLTREQQLVESLTLQCELSPTQAVGEVLAIREALEEKFDITFKESGAANSCNHGFEWDFVARTKGVAIYLDSSSDGTVCLHIEYQNDYALFIRDQGLSQDNEVASDLDAL